MEELLKQLLDGQNQLFEGQKQITDRLDSMENRLDRIKQNMATKDDMNVLKDAGQTLLELVEKTYRKTEEVALQLDTIADENTFLLKKSAQHDADIRSLRKAL